MGAVHEIQQCEGGATLAIAAQLLANEKLFVFHDDMCRVQPGSRRVGEVACEAPGSVGPHPRRQRLAISMALVFLSQRSTSACFFAMARRQRVAVFLRSISTRSRSQPAGWLWPHCRSVWEVWVSEVLTGPVGPKLWP